MVRILLIVFGACLLVSAGTFALAASFVPEMSGPQTTRTVAWTATSVDLDYPVDAVFRQGPEAKAVITGPKSLVERLQVVDGRISLPQPRAYFARTCWIGRCPKVVVEITAPDVSRFSIHSGADLNIASLQRADAEIHTRSGGDVLGIIDVDHLTLKTSSGGDIRLKGRATRLDLDSSSGGDSNLALLAVEDAVVRVSSGADTVLAPTKSAKVSANSGGDITLKTRPAILSIEENSGGDVSVGG